MTSEAREEFRRSTCEFELINSAMKDFSQTYERFGACVDDQSLKTLPQALCDPDSPGFPGSLFSTVYQLQSSAADVAHGFREFGARLDTYRTEVFDSILRTRADQERFLALDTSEKVFDDLHVLTAAVNGSGALGSRDAKSALDFLWPKYPAALAAFLGRRFRETPSGSPKRSLGEVSGFELMIGFFQFASKSITKLGQRICESGRQLQVRAEAVNFKEDFKFFAQNANLKFIDVSPPPFDRFKFSSKYAAPDIYVIERFVMPYLPVAIAEARAHFAAESTDELDLKKGQFVYLMQHPQNEWVFAMTRAHAKYGFVPSAFVQVRGIGIAVVIKKTQAWNGKVGALLILLGVTNADTVRCQDFRGRHFQFPRTSVAIL
jgi:hypothetical protein